MSDSDDPFDVEPASDETYARGRSPSRFYFSRPFQHTEKYARDAHPERKDTLARFAWKVVDEQGEVIVEADGEGYSLVLRETPMARQQIRAMFFEDDRHVCRLLLQRFSADGRRLQDCFTLRDEEIRDLLDMLQVVEHAEFPDGEGSRLDGAVIREAVRHPEARERLYDNYREELFERIEEDASARDVIAFAHRREQLELFRRLLQDPDFFAGIKGEWGKARPEDVWQELFQRNKWIFGLGLAGQLLLSWQPEKLETVVRGTSAAGAGKRADALMRSAGALSSLCFIEIKRPDTPLMTQHREPFRADAWAIHPELAGGVAQCHSTLDAARKTFHDHLTQHDERGFPTEISYLVRPRSYLIVGSLQELSTSVGRPTSRGMSRSRTTGERCQSQTS